MFDIENFAFKRGDKAKNDALVGPQGSFSIDTESKTIRIHDGATPGGAFEIGAGSPFYPELGGFVTSKWRTMYNGSGSVSPVGIDLSNPDLVRVLVNGALFTDWSINDGVLEFDVTVDAGSIVEVMNIAPIADIVTDVLGTDSVGSAFNDLLEQNKGEANGIAPLGEDGKVPMANLPDIGAANYEEVTELPAVGEGTTTYVLTTDGDSTWRWTGTRYVNTTTTYDTTRLITVDDTIDLGVIS